MHIEFFAVNVLYYITYDISFVMISFANHHNAAEIRSGRK